MQLIEYGEAIHQGTRQEMEHDSHVFVYGLGVDDPKGIYGTTLDLHKKFGKNRCFDTPLSEDAMTGFGIGAAIAGFRPIHVHQRMDFLLLCMNQLINMASKQCYMSNGVLAVPFVIRCVIGRSWGQGAQHSQSFHSFFMHVPGIKIIAPTTPYDAKGAVISAIRDNNPVVLMEHRLCYKIKGYVPEERFVLEIPKARILEKGEDITLVGISHTVLEISRAKLQLEEFSIAAEVIDLVCLSPLDINTIIKSVEKTKKLIVVDAGWVTCGAASEIIMQVLEKIEGKQTIQFKRIGNKDTPCPTTRCLEEEFYPNATQISTAAYYMVKGRLATDWAPKLLRARELETFKGPF